MFVAEVQSHTTSAIACSPGSTHFRQHEHRLQPLRVRAHPVETIRCWLPVTTGSVRHRLLLLSSNSSRESEFLAAPRWATTQQPDLPFELWFFRTEPTLELLDVLNTLDRIRSGFFFWGVHLTPSASTWSRVRHSSNPGQPPFRSRRETLGLSLLHSCSPRKNDRSNTEIEVCSWFVEQALHLSHSYIVRVLSVSPLIDNLGGDGESEGFSMAINGSFLPVWSPALTCRLYWVQDSQRRVPLFLFLTNGREFFPVEDASTQGWTQNSLNLVGQRDLPLQRSPAALPVG